MDVDGWRLIDDTTQNICKYHWPSPRPGLFHVLVRSAEDVLLCVMMRPEGDEASHLLGYGVKLIKKI